MRGVGAFLFSCFLSFFFVEKSTWGGLFYLFCFCFVFLCRIFFPLQFVCFHFFLSFYLWGVLSFLFCCFIFFLLISFFLCRNYVEGSFFPRSFFSICFLFIHFFFPFRVEIMRVGVFLFSCSLSFHFLLFSFFSCRNHGGGGRGAVLFGFGFFSCRICFLSFFSFLFM